MIKVDVTGIATFVANVQSTQIENKLKEVLTKLGENIADPNSLRGRLHCVHRKGVGITITEFYLDGAQILRVGSDDWNLRFIGG